MTHHDHVKLQHDIQERAKQKLTPPKFEVNLIREHRPQLWMNGMEHSESISYKNKLSIWIAAAIVIICMLGYSLIKI